MRLESSKDQPQYSPGFASDHTPFSAYGISVPCSSSALAVSQNLASSSAHTSIQTLLAEPGIQRLKSAISLPGDTASQHMITVSTPSIPDSSMHSTSQKPELDTTSLESATSDNGLMSTLCSGSSITEEMCSCSDVESDLSAGDVFTSSSDEMNIYENHNQPSSETKPRDCTLPFPCFSRKWYVN